MSGRISAIAGVREPSGKITLFVGAASGGVWKSDDSGTDFARYLTSSRCNRSALSRSIRRIRKMSGSEPVNRGRATAFPLATESISQPMAVKRGNTQAWENRNALREWSLIRGTATRSSPRSRRVVERFARPWSLQNNRWRQNVAASSQGNESFDRLHRCKNRSN